MRRVEPVVAAVRNYRPTVRQEKRSRQRSSQRGAELPQSTWRILPSMVKFPATWLAREHRRRRELRDEQAFSRIIVIARTFAANVLAGMTGRFDRCLDNRGCEQLLQFLTRETAREQPPASAGASVCRRESRCSAAEQTSGTFVTAGDRCNRRAEMEFHVWQSPARICCR